MDNMRPNDHDHVAVVPDLPEDVPTWLTQHAEPRDPFAGSWIGHRK